MKIAKWKTPLWYFISPNSPHPSLCYQGRVGRALTIPVFQEKRQTHIYLVCLFVCLFNTTESIFDGFPGGASGKNPSANAGDVRDTGSISGLGRSPGGGHGKNTPVFSFGESHGQRSLAGYSP